MEDNVKTPSFTPHYFHHLCIRPFQKLIQLCSKTSEQDDPITAHAASLARRTAQLQQLNEHLVFCEEIQRKTIASDLHDSIAQTLGMGISRIKNFTECGTTPKKEDLHDIQYILEQAVREKTEFGYTNHVKDPVPLNHALKVTSYRAANELLTNIRKHAGARKAKIVLSVTDKDIILQVKDQGKGMDTEKIKSRQDVGFGLYSLSERIQNFGGTLTIDSAPGQGTHITITTPLQTKESAHEKKHAHHCG